MIGNDIVDLQYFEFPRHQHVRHLERVCTASEARAVRQSGCAARSFAVAWASKEAAYKLMSRDLALPHFLPREFAIQLDESDSLDRVDELRVSFGLAEARVTLSANPRWVHAIATSSHADCLAWQVREVQKSSGAEITPQEESEAVRSLAAELLRERGWKNVFLDFECRIPTLRQQERDDVKAGISLSHHGAFVAVAVARSRGNPGNLVDRDANSMLRESAVQL